MESPDELTLRAEEVGTSKALVIVDHIEQERWGPLLTGMPSARRWKTCMSLAKKEAQKTKALWKIKAAKDAGEEYFDSTREDNIKGRNKTRLALWEEHLKDPLVALDKALKCVEGLY